MSIKRVSTLLLAFCLVFTLIAPSVTAVTVDSSVSTPSQNGAASTDKNNSLLVSGNGVQSNGLNTLRGQESSNHNSATENTAGGNWTATPSDKNVDVQFDTELSATLQELREAAEVYSAEDVVSAFVVMEDKPLAETYSSINSVPSNVEARLQQLQDAVITRIEEDVLNGKELDVEHQFTYLTNSVVINVEFGKLEQIAKLPNVKSVFLTPVYQPCSTKDVASPYTVSSGEMSNVDDVWNTPDLGFTGKGMTVAVIDTGLDMDHPSFAADPALGAASWNADYVASKLDQLNAHEINPNLTAEDLYQSAKLPYTFDYVAGTTNVNHNPYTGDHGSHVAGIVAANKVDGVNVVGMAPDAQLVIMQVFTPGSGAQLVHILAALEDALTLECDVANLSLGSPAGFSTYIDEVMEIYGRIADTDIIVDIAAGNEGTSSYGNMWGTNLNPTEHPDNGTVSSPATYPNAMSVASVENVLVPGNYFSLADGTSVYYMDSVEYFYGYTEVDMTDLVGQNLEYVMVPGLGSVEDFEQVDVAGKVAVVSRGELSFAEKAQNAENAGAVAVLIWNNVSENIFNFGMTTEDEYGNIPYIPVALISQEDGKIMEAAAEKNLTVSETNGYRVDVNGGQVSSFSSWGVTPDLRLLPDIAGVGGNVLSCYDDGEYGLMSGTSMASPQVAGVTALVLQYLKETFPNATASEIRTLADSLMMSTAVPIISNVSGVEASPRQQGAGLVNALYAITSEAYITVEGSARPKAELGDSEDGKYTFTFTVHNYGEDSKTYTLSSSLLTENFVEIDGKEYMAGNDCALDDSAVTFTENTLTVAAGATATVTVTIDLTAADKEWIEAHFANGIYVEGYIYLDSEDAVDLSLPFMGFYGDWTEAPLFDTAYWYDSSFWMEDAEPEGNEFWHIMWTNLDGTDYVLGFNPYTGGLADENGNMIYDPANNVVSPNGDGLLDNITEYYLSLMRNARELNFVYTTEDGEVVYRERADWAQKTMYMSSYGKVVPYLHSWYFSEMYDYTDANGEPLPSGTKLTLTISGTVDYEGSEEQYMAEIPITVDTEGAKIIGEPVEFTEDGKNYVQITVEEDALAAVFLYNPAGTQMLNAAYDVLNFTRNEDGTYTVILDVTGYGNDLLLYLCDYGANEVAYELTFEAENKPEVDLDALYGYRVADDEILDDSLFGWITIDKETAETTQLTNDMYEYYALTAAEYAGGYVFAVDAGHNFIVMEPGLWFRNEICNLGINVVDMAFDKTTSTMYLTAKTEIADYEYEYALYTLDLLTCELTMVHEYRSQYEMPWAMTFVDGTLYAIKYYYSGFYTVYTGEPYEVEVDSGYGYTYTEYVNTWDLLPVTDAEGNNFVPVTSTGATTSANYAQSMTYSEADGVIYWTYYKSSWQGNTAELFAIDVETLEYTATEFPVGAECVGVLTLDDDGYTLPESDELSGLVLGAESVIVKENEQFLLTATPMPWNYEAGPITWTSDDESVATVDENGVITGITEGQAVITATCEGISASCIVNVVHIEGTVYAYNYFSGDYAYGDWVALDLETMTKESLYASPVDFVAADYNGHDGNIYGYDDLGQFYRFNPTTGECTALGTAVASVPMDMAYDYSTGFMYAITIDEMMGVSTLHYVNMNTGALIKVADAYGLFLLTLACDTEGGLYAMNSDGTLLYLYLYESDFGGGGVMPLSEGETEVTMAIEPVFIMDGFGSLMYQQSMTFDHNARKLIWAAPEIGTIYWIDPFAMEPYAVSLGDPTGTGFFEYLGLYTIPEEIPELPYAPVTGISAEDMLVLVGGQKMPSATIYPLNATNQAITWTSSDETVAYVNESGVVVGVAEGVITLTGTLVDGENTYEVTITVTVKEVADMVYGYILTDLATYGGFAWAEIDPLNPNYPEYPASTNYMIYSQEYVNGKVYAYGVDTYDWEANWQFMTINPKTYEIESMIDMGHGFPFVYDMTYDYTTGTMYAVVGYDDTSSDLYMINMANGGLIPVMETEPFFASLAAAPDGTLYAMAMSEESFDWETWSSTYSNALLYKLDVENGTYEVAFDTGVKSNMIASMTFDHDTGDLYWSGLFQGSPSSNGLYMIDMQTQTAYNLGSIGMLGSQTVGLYIIAENYPEPPAELLNVTLTSTTEELSVGETVGLDVFMQPSNLEVEMSWASNDESVATVDENGVVTAVAPGTTVVTVTVTHNGNTYTSSCAIIVYSEDDYFLSYNATEGGWSHISRGDVTNESVVAADEEGVSGVQSMVMIDGVIYAFDKDNKFFKTTEESGFVREYLGEADVEMLDLGDYTCLFEIADMAYDAVNGRVLAIGSHIAYNPEYGDTNPLEGYSKLYEVDLATGHMTEVVTLLFDTYTSAQNTYAMTVTPDGTVYVYETFSDYICTVDMETGILSKLNSTSRQSVYGGSDCEDMAMVYDPITCDLFLLMTSNGTFYRMFQFDPDSNALTNLDKVGEVIQVDDWTYLGDSFAGLVINAEHTHAWDVSYFVSDATCTEGETWAHKCLICGETETYTVGEGTGHSFGEWVETKAPTCTEKGEKSHTCSVCGHVETEEIEALGHSYKDTVVAPTPESNGYTEHICEVCGDSYKDNYTEYEDPTNSETGDAFQAGLVMLLMTASVLGLGALVLNRKKFIR